MPETDFKFLPRDHLLSYEELHEIVKVMAGLGVDSIRITGGEPLVREGVDRLVAIVKETDGIREVAMTSNAVLLDRHAKNLKTAGLDRLNISLDSLDQHRFAQITRRDFLNKVLIGIDSAIEAGFENIRLNAVAIKGLTEPDVLPLARFALEKKLTLRFIEFMPLDGEGNWDDSKVLSGDVIRDMIGKELGGLKPANRENPSQPAVDFFYQNHPGQMVGFINPVSNPFCQDCNRLRITAEGKLHNCLFSPVGWDLKDLLRNGASKQEIAERIQESVRKKEAGHLIGKDQFQRPGLSMYQIGG